MWKRALESSRIDFSSGNTWKSDIEKALFVATVQERSQVNQGCVSTKELSGENSNTAAVNVGKHSLRKTTSTAIWIHIEITSRILVPTVKSHTVTDQNFPFPSSNIQSSPVYGFFSHNSSDTPELAPLIYFYFWGRCDFPICFSGRDMSRNVWNRLLGSSMVGTGILPNNMRSPSPECYTKFWMMTTYSNTLHW